VFFFIGISAKFFNSNHKLLSGLNAGILPFYILHQTIIIVIGFFVIKWELSILLKFLVIFISSLGISIVLYQIIRRNNSLRILFGMKNKQKSYNLAQTLQIN